MGLIKEPKNIDMSTKSQQWTKQELAEFREMMQAMKIKNAKRKEQNTSRAKKPQSIQA